MCGVFGWSTPRPLEGGDRLMSKALGRLGHRGPDGEGANLFRTRLGGEIALGHRRLSIIDIEGGVQPMTSGDGRFTLTFNGEIYNFIELRAELEAKGAQLRTRSDTEVVIEAYRAWGEACLTRLRGMFALALYDAREERLILARDPFGKKPLFLARSGGGWAFSSEIAPLLDMPGVSRRLNTEAIGPYLMDRYVSGPQTMFSDVRKLQPGTWATIDGRELRETRYVTPPFAHVRPEPIPLAEAVRRLRNALDESVRLRMRSDAPFGAFLSGGLDSSVIVALMARHCARPISTFSVGFEDARYSEAAEARRVAERVGADHTSIVVTPQDFADTWRSAVGFRGAPVSEASDIPILLLSEAARASVKMVLTGEGADELLAGYPKHVAERYLGSVGGLWPSAAHRSLIDPLLQRLLRDARLKTMSRALATPDPSERARLWFAGASPADVERLTGRPAPALFEDDPPTGLSPMRGLQLADQRRWLPDNLLERGDRMMMGASIEGRMPFMDTELSKVVARFPDRLLVARGQGKRVLRHAVRDLVDRRTLNRRKVGFRVPVGDWMRTGALRDRLRDLLQSKASVTRRLLKAPEIDSLIDEHVGSRRDHEKVLWTLANLELFLRVYRVEIH